MMQNIVNQLGQPIGEEVPNWAPVSRPSTSEMHGQYCTVSPLNIVAHAASLFAANAEDKKGSMWTYLPYGPFENIETYHAWLRAYCTHDEPLFYVITDKNNAIGLASYLRIDPNNGSIEIGHLAYSPALQRTRVATEAMFLMINHVFNLGYRRVEWKCNALNAPSMNAAVRLGFRFEGTFRQAAVIKGHNRDTAWYSILDKEWPALKSRYERWLEKSNFNADGSQKIRLQDC